MPICVLCGKNIGQWESIDNFSKCKECNLKSHGRNPDGTQMTQKKVKKLIDKGEIRPKETNFQNELIKAALLLLLLLIFILLIYGGMILIR